MKTSCKIAREIKTSTSKTCMLFKIACKGAQSCHILSGFFKSVPTFWVAITHNIHRPLFSLSLCRSHTSWFSWLHCCCMSPSCSSRERFCSSSLSSFSCTSCRSVCRRLSSSEPFWTSSCRSWERKRESLCWEDFQHLYQSNNKQDFINTDITTVHAALKTKIKSTRGKKILRKCVNAVIMSHQSAKPK